MKLKLFITFVLGFLFFGSFLITSCKKKTECKVIVTTVDSSNVPLGGATVRLYVNTPSTPGKTLRSEVDVTGTSGSDGKSQYTFDLTAILDISATSGTKSGTGLVKLVEGETVTATVIVQ